MSNKPIRVPNTNKKPGGSGKPAMPVEMKPIVNKVRAIAPKGRKPAGRGY